MVRHGRKTISGTKFSKKKSTIVSHDVGEDEFNYVRRKKIRHDYCSSPLNYTDHELILFFSRTKISVREGHDEGEI